MKHAHEDSSKFTDKQLNELKARFATISTVDPKHLDRFHKQFDSLGDDALIQVSEAGIKFVSPLARNACIRRQLIQVPSYDSLR